MWPVRVWPSCGSIRRRLAAAEEQIVSAQIAAIKEVKDTAVTVAIAAAKDVISIGMNTSHANDLIESAIKDVNGKFRTIHLLLSR